MLPSGLIMYARISLFAIAIVVLGLISLVPTLQFPSSEQVSTFIGPRVWPLILLLALIGLGAALLLITWRDAKQGKRYDDEPIDEAPSRSALRWHRPAIGG